MPKYRKGEAEAARRRVLLEMSDYLAGSPDCGYTHDAVKIFQHQGEPVRVPYREHVPPDTTAAIFWLKNRRPEEWRDRHNHEISGKNGGAIEVTDTAAVNLARRVAFLLARAAHEPALIEAEATEAEETEAET